MKFGEIPVAEAEGSILAHSVRTKETVFKKGRRLTPDDVAALISTGVKTIFAATLEPDDVPEDEAAKALAEALAGTGITLSPPFTGRANLLAASAGLVQIDARAINRINQIDEALTVATLNANDPATAGQMLATIKIIPFACPKKVLDEALEIAKTARLCLAPFQPKSAGLILTEIEGLKNLTAKSRQVLEARLHGMNATIGDVRLCAHDRKAVADAITAQQAKGLDPILLLGASATVDRRDVIPAAIEQAGGEILHYGMPVDPGNLLLLARHGATTIIGLPGCARSPKLNGVDWVLQRLFAGLAIDSAGIMNMGVGGLLKEMPARPQPRAGKRADTSRPIAAIVLAAGQSRRMGATNKLLADIDGKPMIVRVVETLKASKLASSDHPIIVVTGHEAARIKTVLDGHDVHFVDNPNYGEGLSTSLAAGLNALEDGVEGAMICLGDMPNVTPDDLDQIIAAFDPEEDRAICVPTVDGKRGNPVLWSAAFFEDMKTLKGDVGARHLIGEAGNQVCEVPLKTRGTLEDFDTPEALNRLKDHDR